MDEEALAAVRSLARASGRPIGAVVSELVLRALRPPADLGRSASGFPTFPVTPGAAPLTTEAVQAALDDE